MRKRIKPEFNHKIALYTLAGFFLLVYGLGQVSEGALTSQAIAEDIDNETLGPIDNPPQSSFGAMPLSSIIVIKLGQTLKGKGISITYNEVAGELARSPSGDVIYRKGGKFTVIDASNPPQNRFKERDGVQLLTFFRDGVSRVPFIGDDGKEHYFYLVAITPDKAWLEFEIH